MDNNHYINTVLACKNSIHNEINVGLQNIVCNEVNIPIPNVRYDFLCICLMCATNLSL